MSKKTDTPAAFITTPDGYADWLAELKNRTHTAQQRAALAVNRELILLYWQIGRDILARQAEQAGAGTALFNSSLFYAYFIAYSDCFHLSDTLASGFPVTEEVLQDNKLAKLNGLLMTELDSHSERKTITSRRGGSVDRIEYDEYYGARCKSTIDQIDMQLAELYRLTADETDFIINYDIKYRMSGAEDEA